MYNVTISMQTMVKKTVTKFGLFMCYKHLPESVSTVGFYFLRVSADPIPLSSSLDQAKSELPAFFETGTINTKPLNALEKMMTYMFMPKLKIQGEDYILNLVVYVVT